MPPEPPIRKPTPMKIAVSAARSMAVRMKFIVLIDLLPAPGIPGAFGLRIL